ncbi:MFS transporter [Paenibacillus sp. HN-1]|uniref:MFS transporter n=1 Tax=Paenibacillus TaxID=44249 RepID=UPI001CA8D1E5|nr:MULTISPECIES: MFS transporter [Paenibacillus]MBY9080722.1 MFS transporter [Paenibacillus sp. CGMCC 1.18879]MBY9085286.1 MFS transporter [Paenibacillus sinensis]
MQSHSKDLNWSLVINASIASYLDAGLLVSAGIALAIWPQQFNIGPWMAGFISTLLTLSVAFGSFVGGYLSDKFGRTRVFNLDILFVVIGTAIIAFAPSLPWLMSGLVIAGIASGADLPTSLAVISERTSDDKHGKAMTVTEIFWIGGIVLSQGLGFLTAGLGTLSNRFLFLWLALVALVTWLIRVFSPRFKQIEEEALWKNPDPSSNPTADNQKISLLALLKVPRYLAPMIMLAGFYLFWNLPANTWGSFLNYFLVTVDNRSQSFATLVAFVANILGVFVLYFIYMKFADTKYRYRMMHIGLALCILSFIVSAAFGGVWYMFTACYVLYCMANMLHGEPLYKIWSQTLYPANVRATVTGFTYASVRLLTAVFSLVTPVIMNYSPTLLMWLLAGSLLVCWICGKSIIRFIVKKDIADTALRDNPATSTNL